VIIWLVAAGALVVVQWYRPTPQKFINYVAEHPVRGLDEAMRAKIITKSAQILNGLNTNQRRELKERGALRTFFTELTTEERRRFVRLTLPEGFRQMIATLNVMEPAQRKKVVQRTLRNLQNAEGNEFGSANDIEEIFSEGSSIFNEAASPQVILDFAPVIEAARNKQKKSSAKSALPKL
jgi:hypothetical protein